MLSDVIERGFYDDNDHDNDNAQQGGDESRPGVAASSAKPTLSLSLSELQGNNNKSGEVNHFFFRRIDRLLFLVGRKRREAKCWAWLKRKRAGVFAEQASVQACRIRGSRTRRRHRSTRVPWSVVSLRAERSRL